MNRLLLYFIFLIVLIVQILPSRVSAQQYATCDRCGLCADVVTTSDFTLKNYPSDSWPGCMECLYPSITLPGSNNYGDFKSLEMIPDPENLANTIPNPPEKGRFYTGLGCFTTDLTDFEEEGAAAALTRPLLNVLMSLAGGIAFLYLLYGAFLIVTSRGDPEQLSHGKRTIIGAIIGVVFAMSAVFIINMIASGILRIPGFQ